MATVKVKSLYGKLHLYGQVIPLNETGDFEEEALANPEVEKLVELGNIEILKTAAVKKEEPKKADPKKVEEKKAEEA